MSKWVIKIGTSVLRGDKSRPTKSIIENYCRIISDFKKKGEQVVLVSSGAVGLGCHRIGINKRPVDVTSLQATAAIGQGYLMSLYEEYMSTYGYNVAQVLLTRADFSSRKSYRNASNTLNRLLEWNILPIVNENDTISDEELLYGDNDTLSALLSIAIKADKLVLLTDIDKLYSSDPKTDRQATPILEVHNTQELLNLKEISNPNTPWGTGGISTKLTAAKIATEAGIKVHLADGRKSTSLDDIFCNSRVGTVFYPQPNPVPSKKSWLAHALHPLGTIYIDEGASNALKHKGASLLLVGIKNIKGNFNANQPIRIIDTNGNEIGRGISSLSSTFIQNTLHGLQSIEKSPIVVHRDVLVLIN